MNAPTNGQPRSCGNERRKRQYKNVVEFITYNTPVSKLIQTTRMSSFNIEINGQKSFNVPIVIERAMPAELETYMSNGEWNSFCDQVDNALAPAMQFKQNTMARFKLLCSIPLALMLVFIAVSSA